MSENKEDPKEIEKVQKLLSDEEFVKKLISQETVEDAKKLFEDQEIATNIEEMEMLGRFIKKISQKGNEKLSEEDLEEVVGGGKLENATIRLQVSALGALFGMICGASVGNVMGGLASGIAGFDIDIYERSKKNNTEKIRKYERINRNIEDAGSIIGMIAGVITGAIKGYKIAGKWCD